MTSATQNSSYTDSQIQVWLRSLLTVAWADGQFDEAEKSVIHEMVESEFAPNVDFDMLEPIEPAALADLQLSDEEAQNFLRMAVMVAIADGVFSEPEYAQITAFAEALALEPAARDSLQSMLAELKLSADVSADADSGVESSRKPASDEPTSSVDGATASPLRPPTKKPRLDPLKPTRQWLDQLSVDDPRLARFVCKLVPAQCPFERDVTLFGHKVVHIPPMCKINPLYEQLVGLRFRALSYLADERGEDVTPYI